MAVRAACQVGQVLVRTSSVSRRNPQLGDGIVEAGRHPPMLRRTRPPRAGQHVTDPQLRPSVQPGATADLARKPAPTHRRPPPRHGPSHRRVNVPGAPARLGETGCGPAARTVKPPARQPPPVSAAATTVGPREAARASRRLSLWASTSSPSVGCGKPGRQEGYGNPRGEPSRRGGPTGRRGAFTSGASGHLPRDLLCPRLPSPVPVQPAVADRRPALQSRDRLVGAEPNRIDDACRGHLRRHLHYVGCRRPAVVVLRRPPPPPPCDYRLP